MTPKEIGARPAHPTPPSASGLTNGSPGLTIRQAYKMAALQLIDDRYTINAGNEAACAYEVARYSGMLADALLAEDAEHEKGNT